MKLINNFKQWLIHWVWILTIIAIAWISYSAYQTTIDRAVSNTLLTAEKYNQLVDRLEEIDQKQLATAWVNFDWTNCPSNICDIRDSYNVSSVTRNYNGNYTINFENFMQNSNYSTFLNHWDVTQRGWDILISQTSSWTRVETRDEHWNEINASTINVQVFWGK